ncbi:glycosyltransferase family 2 protein [Flavobacterium sp. GCM10027622]|uniref:glycosyltransferase family 2 protein n=1 Tax=unclassified Flavobacterium TaxID=196869 RepID=UPI003605E430
MIKKPIVSVICLCYNHEEYVTDALDSIIKQTYDEIEIIIIDDCSTDKSVEKIELWLQNHPEIVFIQNKANLGNTKSFNIAAKQASGEYLIDFATDDLLIENCIKKQVDRFQNSIYKNLGLVYGNTLLVNEKGEFHSYFFDVDHNEKTIVKRPTGRIFDHVIDTGKAICSVSGMVSKKAFDELNGYDEQLAYEDLDLWVRLSYEYEIDYIDSVLVKKRIISNSLGSQFHREKKYSQKINHSTYLILKKIIRLVTTKNQCKALLRKINYEINLSIKSKNYGLLIKLLIVKMKTHWLMLIKPNFS